jgi:glyoxylate/hydroxypyruvate reductase A
MAFALISRSEDAELWRHEFALKGQRDFRVWPDIGNGCDVVMAAFDREGLRHEVFEKLPNLRCAVYLGHGVDHLIGNPILPRSLSIVRLRDEGIVRAMTEFVVLHVLARHRDFTTYIAQQKEHRWNPLHSPSTTSVQLGVMGLGSIGEAIAQTMKHLKFKVSGWARTKHRIEGVECHHGLDELTNFLAPLDYVVCVLPLTRETENIINSQTISAMKAGAYFINIGRGKLVVESDLLNALDSGHLSGATLDVFRTEPLPSRSRFWTHPRVLVTPHEAGAEPGGSVPVIAENYRRLLSGQPLLNVINPALGY